jgi:hypothetical protein
MMMTKTKTTTTTTTAFVMLHKGSEALHITSTAGKCHV